MGRTKLRCALMGGALLGALTTGALTMNAQEQGNWRAASSTAKGVTGDIALTAEKLWVNFSSFTIAEIRNLEPGEASAIFNTAGGGDENGAGHLYRLEIPAAKKFLHHNTMCGAEDTQWMATYASGRSLQVAFFSGAAMPVMTPEAMANSTLLCGTYSYGR